MPITLEEEKNKQTKNPENHFIMCGFEFSTEPSVVLSQMRICHISQRLTQLIWNRAKTLKFQQINDSFGGSDPPAFMVTPVNGNNCIAKDS